MHYVISLLINIFYYYILAITIIFINHRIFDHSLLFNIYDNGIIIFEGNKNYLLEISDYFHDVLPEFVKNLKTSVNNDSLYKITFQYFNGIKHKGFIKNLINVVKTDYPEVTFNYFLEETGYYRTKNTISCIYASLVTVFTTSLLFTQKDKTHRNVTLQFILSIIASVLALITMIYLEKETQIITLNMFKDEQKILLTQNIIIDIVIIMIINFFVIMSLLIKENILNKNEKQD